MTVRDSFYREKLLSFLLIVMAISMADAFGQKLLSGNLRQPSTHVYSTSGAGGNWVKVDDLSGFSVNDTVLLIQIQGVGIITPTDQTYGDAQQYFGAPGRHEFLIIQAINAPDQVIFRNNILNSYKVSGSLQLVRVPYYNSVIISSTLYCDPWDPVTKKGGVLTFIAGRSVRLNADIDVTGLGLRGAQDVAGTGICRDNATTVLSTYPGTFTNAGLKGEGIAIHNDVEVLLIPTHVKGEGANYTGGGGGNGRYSGGGGGSHMGKGGTGGEEDPLCATGGLFSGDGGKGGYSILSKLPDRIFFGGGGGGSTSTTGTSGARGGNGGGIIIIVTDTIFSSGGKIIASGESGSSSLLAGGAGGGGGGGTVALSLTNFGQNELQLIATGGKGGNSQSGQGGGGGGGGGGLIFLSKSAAANVTPVISGGVAGSNGTPEAGTAGQKLETFTAVLNGFLFNSIRSSVTGTQSDSVCSNTKPSKITGTTPIGGQTPYTYTWQKSYDKTTWSDLVIDNSSVNYTPAVFETNPVVWFRRIVTDFGGLQDISIPVQIKVHPFIKNNTVGNDQTICYSQNPAALIPTATLSDGTGHYTYIWKVSTDNVNFTLPANSNNSASYTPAPALTVSSWFNRTVTSGRCIDVSAPVKVTVLDSIKNNKILNSPADICFGMTFSNLQGTTTSTSQVLAGGDNTFRFAWESNINGAGWTGATGQSNTTDYNPVELPSRQPYNNYLFRRVVRSGPADVCMSISNTVHFRDYPVISNNTIATDQVICSGAVPAKISGSQPANGDGTYVFTWQDLSKTHSWKDIPGAVKISSPDFQPQALTDTTIFRRIVYSSACGDTSKSLKIVVHKPILNNLIAFPGGSTDTVICSNQTPHILKGTIPSGGTNLSDHIFQWLFSTDNIKFSNVTSLGNSPSYQPPASIATTWYKRHVSSGACEDMSPVIKTEVLPLLSNNNISGDQTICVNSTPLALAGTMPAGGNGAYNYIWEQSADGGTIWKTASGSNALPGYSPPALASPMKYRRRVVSGLAGCCALTSLPVTVLLHPPLPTGKIVNTVDTSICAGSNVLLKLDLTGTGYLKVIYKENSSEVLLANKTSGRNVHTLTPASATVADVYNYSIVSIEDGNGCKASSVSGSKTAKVFKVPIANAGPDQTLCGSKVTMAAVSSFGSGTWSYRFPASQVQASSAHLASGQFTIDSALFADGIMTRRFLWEEINWQCKSRDSVDITFIKRPDHINAGNDTILFTFDQVFHLANDPPRPWEEGSWSVLSGTGNISGGIITGLSANNNSFEWRIKNRMETCVLSDILNIEVYPVVVPMGISPNSDRYNSSLNVKGLDLENLDVEMTIMNGAGAEVFSTYSHSGDTSTWKDWDGTNSQGAILPEGTYYYLIKMISRNEGASKKVNALSGFIILKRH